MHLSCYAIVIILYIYNDRMLVSVVYVVALVMVPIGMVLVEIVFLLIIRVFVLDTIALIV